MGLLLLRLAVATFLIHDAFAALAGETYLPKGLPQLIAAGVGVLLIAGLWTPIAGGLAALIELRIAFSRPGDSWASMLAVAIASGLAMLGPGAWSIDARRFGRKRISIRDR